MRPLPLLGLLLLVGCRQNSVQAIAPSLGLEPAELDFGPVKLKRDAVASVELRARTRAAVELSAVELRGDGFALGELTRTIAGLESVQAPLTFHPTEQRAWEATLVLESNDPELPSQTLRLAGQGEVGRLQLTPGCEAASGCQGLATLAPLALDFGQEPFSRALELPPEVLPRVELASVGLVPLGLTGLFVEGPDAAAFLLVEPPAAGLELAAGERLAVPLRFKPTSEAQTVYAATLVVQTDDPSAPETRVALSGERRANLPPTVCANLTRVAFSDGSPPGSHEAGADWAPLLVAPAGGYDFSQSREVTPGTPGKPTVLTFSALSSADLRACTSDPEDGRLGLSWEWAIVSRPMGGVATLTRPREPTTELLLGAGVGPWELSLTVTDFQGHATTTSLRFVSTPRRDLVVELAWSQPDGGGAGVDLDLHLVRPTAPDAGPFAGAFSFFGPGGASDDINGYTAFSATTTDGGGGFDWGEPGRFDDPRLLLDDTGSGPLLERVALNYPGNDPHCAAGPCTYRVLVHAFRDARPAMAFPITCTVGGSCADGQACTCPAEERCVAREAPTGAAPSGAGVCLPAARPVVRVYFRGQAGPAAELPLPTLLPADELALGAPCQLLHLADVVWPARGDDAGTAPLVRAVGADGSGRIVAPAVRRYGVRSLDSRACEPNLTSPGGVPWFGAEP